MELILRALEADDEAELLRILREPEVARWWDEPDEGFPFTDEPGAVRFAIVVDGAVAGMIQYHEELEPKYRSAGIDLYLDPALHGQGLGTAAVRELAGWLIAERGHHRITIDPAAANAAAIRAYGKAGFVPVGVMHGYERDVGGPAFHDGLLMELVVGHEGDERPGLPRVVPQLSVRRGREAVAWYASAFGAVVDYQVGGTDAHEAIVARLRVGESTFWVADESPEHANFAPESVGGATTRLLLEVAAPEEVVSRAVAAGAREVRPVVSEHRWRLGRIEDPFGHHWEIGRPDDPAWPRGAHGAR